MARILQVGGMPSRRCTILAAALVSLATLTMSTRVQADAIEPPAAIARTAESFARGSIPGDTRNVLVETGHLDARLRLAACATPLQADWAAGHAPRARATVVVSCESGKRWRIHVPVTIRSRVDVLVLRRPLPRGGSIDAADVTRRSLEVDGLSHLYIGNLAEVAGRHLVRPAPAGTPLLAAWFVADALVKKGQDITLVARTSGVEIRASGRAMANAALGQRVRVQNMSSLKIVEGVVETGPRVRVMP